MDTGGYAAFVTTAQYGDGTADVIDMQFDLPDFFAPHTQPNSTADRTVAHEVVHLMQAQNSYYGDITGDGSSRGTWFKEGLAEFIHGADNRVNSILNNNGNDFASLVGAIGTGNESWTSSDQYATAYLAVKYLHSRIVASGQSDGIKHMTTWMKNQFDASQGASNSGIDDYFQTFNISKASGGNFSSNADFVSNYKGLDGLNFISQLRSNNKFSNTDTGSILGSDEGGVTALNARSVVPDASGSPQSNFVKKKMKQTIRL